MGYLTAPQNQFQPGLQNPAFGAFGKGGYAGGLRKPGGRLTPGGGGGRPNVGGSTITSGGGVTPWAISHGYGSPQADTGIMSWTSPTGGGGGGTATTSGGGGAAAVPGWLRKLRRDASGAFAGGDKGQYGGPDIPGQREMPEFQAWEGQEWVDPDIQARGATDIEAVMAANTALMQERLGGEMGEAARKFGSLGMMQSAGGLGSGYLGTLAESERGVRRDLGEIEARYGFEAAQQAAQLQHQREQAAAERQARAFESGEGRRYGAWGREQDYGWDKYGAGSDYDRWAYGAGVEKDLLSRQAEQDNINMMMMLYGS